MATSKANPQEYLPLVGGLFSSDREAAAQEEYQRKLAEAKAQFDALQGDKALTSLQVSPSGLNDIFADPRSVEAQMSALNTLLAESQSKGATVQDLAALNDIRNRQITQTKGTRDAILQQARNQGRLGSGATLAAELSNEAEGARNANMQGLQAAADARARMLQSALSAGQLGSQVRSQSFGEKAQKASAQDAVNRFNADLMNQMYQNKLGLANAQAGVYAQQGQVGLQGAQRASQTAAGFRSGLEQAGANAALIAATGGAAAPAVAAKSASQQVSELPDVNPDDYQLGYGNDPLRYMYGGR